MRKRYIAKNERLSSRLLLRRFAIRPRTRDRLAPLPAEPAVPTINLPFPTFGGKQIWADQFVCAGWRIQRNHYTGHHRLLDPNNFRRAWEAMLSAANSSTSTGSGNPSNRATAI